MSPETRLNILRHKVGEQSTRLRKAAERLDDLQKLLRRERKEQAAELARLQNELARFSSRFTLLERRLAEEQARASRWQWLFWGLLGVICFMTVVLISPHPEILPPIE